VKTFFNVTDLTAVLEMHALFKPVNILSVPLFETAGRVLAQDIHARTDVPAFTRSVMDGYAVAGASTFGASEANPAYLAVTGTIAMGESPKVSIGVGQACRIATGGMLPDGADCVVMVEHTEALDENTIEVYRSVAPGQNIVAAGEDFAVDALVLPRGQRLRPQDIGVLANLGIIEVGVYRQPVVAIISTGDEIVPIDTEPRLGQIRDTNTYSLAAQVLQAGGRPVSLGIVADNYQQLLERCRQAYDMADMVLISGGSSVGMRDYTIDVLKALPDARILVHGISIRPGKPTILAQAGSKPLWGLPGHVTSAMVVFQSVVQPFLAHIAGCGQALSKPTSHVVEAFLSRNLASVQGRVDYVRVRLKETEGQLWAQPLLGKSALLHTMVKADGLLRIGKNSEGLDQGSRVQVTLF
jgi:molybdopterin molybdotransferase